MQESKKTRRYNWQVWSRPWGVPTQFKNGDRQMGKPNTERQAEWRERHQKKQLTIFEESLAQLRQTQAIINGQVPEELKGKLRITERETLKLLIHIGSFAFKPGFAMVQLDELLRVLSHAQEGEGIPTAEEINDTINAHTVMGMTPWPEREGELDKPGEVV